MACDTRYVWVYGFIECLLTKWLIYLPELLTGSGRSGRPKSVER